MYYVIYIYIYIYYVIYIYILCNIYIYYVIYIYIIRGDSPSIIGDQKPFKWDAHPRWGPLFKTGSPFARMRSWSLNFLRLNDLHSD